MSVRQWNDSYDYQKALTKASFANLSLERKKELALAKLSGITSYLNTGTVTKGNVMAANLARMGEVQAAQIQSNMKLAELRLRYGAAAQRALGSYNTSKPFSTVEQQRMLRHNAETTWTENPRPTGNDAWGGTPTNPDGSWTVGNDEDRAKLVADTADKAFSKVVASSDTPTDYSQDISEYTNQHTRMGDLDDERQLARMTHGVNGAAVSGG